MKKKWIYAAVIIFAVIALAQSQSQSSDISKTTADQTAASKDDKFKETLKLAEQGDAEAQFDLGWKYDQGEGVPQDYKEAVKWYTKAAGQGIAVAQSRLGRMYETGEGVPQDNKEAAKLYTKAAEQGFALAQYFLGGMYCGGRGVQQDYKEAVKWFTKAAEQGFSLAQNGLGLLYSIGEGVPQDYKEAAKWFTKAAEQGYAEAQYSMGFRCYLGEGVPQDCKEAIKWYTKAAEQGHAEAQHNLGLMYKNGLGVPQDYREAVKWYTKAAKQGDALAQSGLGVMYYDGTGVPQDYKEAIKWYTKAAEQGDADAQVNLGGMYYGGKGVPEDYVQAYKWWNLAAAQGDEDAGKKREILRESMSASQIAEAQRLSSEFRPKSQESSSQDTKISAATEVKSSGTGFFITADGYFLTAHHVVEDAVKVQVLTSSGQHTARIVSVDTANDVALLKVDVTGVDALEMKASRSVKTGQDVFTLGFPNIEFQGTEAKYTQGSISSLSGFWNDPRLFQISVAIQPGNSGGPLLDSDGRVVGIVTSKLDEIAVAQQTGSLTQNVNYSLKSSFAMSFLEAIPELEGKLIQAKTSGLSRTEIVEKCGKAVVMVLCY